MNKKRLRIYLEDHLALMVGEIELIVRCHESNQSTNLGRFLERLVEDVRAQQSIADGVLYSVHADKSLAGRMKQGAAWFAEKLGRFKLNDALLEYSDLSRVIELETLVATAQERVNLWASLEEILTKDLSLGTLAATDLKDQSENHLAELKQHHLNAVTLAFLRPVVS
ncbi:MAG: hypothetical protein KDA80_03985 [Planctomycetaceae bacterium]|nr:hypothetical protein [Planctomycetaceae bacterium]